MAKVTVNATALRAKLAKLEANKEAALKAAGLTILAAAQQAIKDSGPGWPAFKKPPKRPHQLLWDTGTLIQSLSVGGKDDVFTLSGDSITVGTNVSYAVWQNEGTKNIPARPFLFMDSERDAKAASAFIKRLTQGL